MRGADGPSGSLRGVFVGAVAPGSQGSLREANSARIVEAVKAYGRITQVELSSVTGLSAATVSNIVKQLLDQGVVQTRATTRSGRRAQEVSLAASSSLGVGVHIASRSLSVVLADSSMALSGAQRLPLPVEHRSDTTLDRTALLIAELADQVGASMDDIAGVGLAIPTALGAGVRPGLGALTGWIDVDIDQLLAARLQRQVLVVREAEAGAVGETRFGALRGVGVGLFVHVADTVDACLMVGGVPFRGAGSAGALGHVRVEPGGAICRCGGRGCLNTVASAEALAEPLRVSHGPMSLRAIVRAAADGDPGCRQVVADAAAAVGGAVADAATLLAPQRVVIGGDLAATGEVFLAPIREALRSRPVLPRDDGLVVPTEDPQMVARGALALIHDAIGPAAGASSEG
ncbi:ROK family transcriptional regulator [Propioniciclava soli]|uniref:ROK family transcriptional regulator n=1 Tax=Propioniciclava soli TaxID=2775081 RepID=UPI0031454444